MNTMHEMMDKAVISIKKKIIPQAVQPQPTRPEYERLFPLLEVWNLQQNDPDSKQKTQFIYDYINSKKEDGKSVEDTLLNILTTIGATPIGESKLNRIYRYCRLKEQADKTLKKYEIIRKEMDAFSDNR